VGVFVWTEKGGSWHNCTRMPFQPAVLHDEKLGCGAKLRGGEEGHKCNGYDGTRYTKVASRDADQQDMEERYLLLDSTEDHDKMLLDQSY
jgi:hypothetical protein